MAGGEVRHQLWGGRIEPDDVEHARIVGVGDAEPVGDHAHDGERLVGAVLSSFNDPSLARTVAEYVPASENPGAR